MQRREFITLLGGAAATWPLAAHAQQRRATPVIGYLSARSSEVEVSMLAAVRRGLKEMGYVEGENLAIEYRFSDGHYDRMQALAADLIGRHVAVIICVGNGTGMWDLLRASQIPIVFGVGTDPVRDGLVASLNRPGGTMTGVNTFVGELTAKQLGLLHDLVPSARTIGLLHDLVPSIGLFDEPRRGQELRNTRAAAATLGLQLLNFEAATKDAIEAAFAAVKRQQPAAMLVVTSPFYTTLTKEIAALAVRHAVPAIYGRREFVEAGGLMSYGYDVADSYRWFGNYAGRILKGDKPGDLPVVQPTKFEVVINRKAAKAIGFEVPTNLLLLADEVIE
jgi:putative ABC transport system substrate-binding protein